jgi:hypothetical protein
LCSPRNRKIGDPLLHLADPNISRAGRATTQKKKRGEEATDNADTLQRTRGDEPSLDPGTDLVDRAGRDRMTI